MGSVVGMVTSVWSQTHREVTNLDSRIDHGEHGGHGERVFVGAGQFGSSWGISLLNASKILSVMIVAS